MEFDFNKLITYKNKEKAEIGKKYYFFSLLDSDIINGCFDSIPISELVGVHSKDTHYIFENDEDYYTFIYPYEEQENQYLTYEELKARWIKNPTELYRNNFREVGMITGFYDDFKTFSFGGSFYSITSRNEEDDHTIKNLTDINGNPLVKE